ARFFLSKPQTEFAVWVLWKICDNLSVSFADSSPGRGAFSAAAGVIFLLYKVSTGSPLENCPQLCYDYCA
ncbi:MAG: hypothetical protein ACLSDS_04850, partial [Oscillospiraceae bacterium]